MPFQAAKKRWTLTCEVAGQVRQTERVYIDRGERKTLNLTACAGGTSCGSSPAASRAG